MTALYFYKCILMFFPAMLLMVYVLLNSLSKLQNTKEMIVMPIVAVSMPESDLEELEFLREEGGFNSRSDVVRQAIQILLSRHQDLDKIKGEVTVVATAVYNKTLKGFQSKSILDNYGSIVSTVMHTKSNTGENIEIMIVKGDAEEVKAFVKEIKGEIHMTRLHMALIGGKVE
ncbi:MAG: ribbon-helix-helix protein, CopG family [Candidatus Lokiarchaeota archaeon]|nr:ribbon-helix-helix protein, CopG family [Candidatus Lokiarchaeota archaeon]